MSGETDGSNRGKSNNHRRDERHKQLLALARDILVGSGLSGLSIERLAKSAKISRPTVYSHFSSKRGVLVGVAEQNLELTRRLMERASTFKGSFRERAFGLILAYEVMARFETEEFHMTEFFGMPWVRSELPREVATSFAEVVTSFFNRVRELVAAGVDAGELKNPGGMTVDNIVFHSLSMSYGIYTSIVKKRIILKLSSPVDPWAEARLALHCFWDGIGWEQGRSEVDWVAVADRFLKEIFPDYWIKQEIDKLRKREGLDVEADAGDEGESGGEEGQSPGGDGDWGEE